MLVPLLAPAINQAKGSLMERSRVRGDRSNAYTAGVISPYWSTEMGSTKKTSDSKELMDLLNAYVGSMQVCLTLLETNLKNELQLVGSIKDMATRTKEIVEQLRSKPPKN